MSTPPASETNTHGLKGQAGASVVDIGRYTYGYETLQVKQWGEGEPLQIGSFCSIGQGVTVFLGGNHRVDWVTTFPFGHVFGEQLGGRDVLGHPTTNGAVVVGNDVWLGDGATIMSGVRIGDGAVVAARAVVTQDVAPYSIVAGNPARLIRHRFPPDIVERLRTLRWWDLPDAEIRKLVHRLSTPPTAAMLDDWIARYRKS
ncbi:CatB-related O-acetyltransferase [Inhella crocodyli]|uniref:CatB-related O-acetyltransferase n=1 Tax=Inhella crocodyli TaxID=2499851 RepID=A0A3S2UHE9_9BURK|nr:CatB-related O-acetyltransferase [Inhella crocodyli]RVT85997.1 CatB-related O-acetyltransferase [Inhella crocodyli]